MCRPDPEQAAAVDVRQQLDLKIGCSFTRLLTRQFVEYAKLTFGDDRISVLSYGPCTATFNPPTCQTVLQPLCKMAVY